MKATEIRNIQNEVIDSLSHSAIKAGSFFFADMDTTQDISKKDEPGNLTCCASTDINMSNYLCGSIKTVGGLFRNTFY